MKENADYTYDVFVSHPAKVREFVTLPVNDLVDAGLKVWFDQWNIKVRVSRVQAIYQAIKESRFLLIVMSPYYFQSI
jgi:hypothetical protein